MNPAHLRVFGPNYSLEMKSSDKQLMSEVNPELVRTEEKRVLNSDTFLPSQEIRDKVRAENRNCIYRVKGQGFIMSCAREKTNTRSRVQGKKNKGKENRRQTGCHLIFL